MLRTKLAASLLTASREHRHKIKAAIFRGNFDLLTQQDLSLLAISPDRFTHRHDTGYYIDAVNTHRALVSYPRQAAPEYWDTESMFAQKIASLQACGKLCSMAKPLVIDHVHKRIIWHTYLKDGAIAPTLASLATSRALQEKLNMWVQAGLILVELHEQQIMHGDFCDEQVCLTDKGPILVDYESMFDLKTEIRICHSQERGKGVAYQVVNGQPCNRPTRTRYYHWFSLVLDKCDTTKSSSAISVSEAIAMEASAFAISVLEQLFGQALSAHDNFYQVQKIKTFHHTYMTSHQEQKTQISTTMEQIVALLLKLWRANISLATAMPELQHLVAQLPV